MRKPTKPSKPREPIEPSKTIQIYSQFRANDESEFTLDKILEELKVPSDNFDPKKLRLSFAAESDYYDNYCSPVILITYDENICIENEYYEAELKRYNRELKAYPRKLEEYKVKLKFYKEENKKYKEYLAEEAEKKEQAKIAAAQKLLKDKGLL